MQRDENLAKRRNFQADDDGLESDDEPEQTGSTLNDSLSQMVHQIYLEDPEQQLDATMKFRK